MTALHRWLLAAVLAILVALPAVLGSRALSIFVFIFFYAYLGQAWNLVSGYGGQLSAGHAAFVGIGAYTTAVLAMHAGVSPWLGMFAGAALAALLGAVVGFLGFRFGLRGFYFVLLTVAFAEVCRIVALNTEAIGGAVGLYIPFTGNAWQLQFQDNRGYYYVALALMLLATGVVALVERGRLGAYLTAIREDEDAAEALGVDTLRCKLVALVLSAFLTGLGGAFYANYLFSLQPNAVFGIPLSVDIILRPVVGGSGTLMGPILGSFILSPLAELSRTYFARAGLVGTHLVAYGLLLVAIVLFLPRGAYPPLARALGLRRSS
ncbi:MAG: branched-chain amino acid ABC transporter permease [Candidatus Rokubacteria bacterium]|nr:branched-chain amino acid ABC transporter permease [Candidatus Rokubacteria bacterium]